MPTTKRTKPIILLVEDDTFLAGMYVTKLTMEHYQVELATDGEAGLKKAMTVVPDLILLDVLLPKINGFDVLRQIKAQSELRHIPVILLTNLGQKSDVSQGLDLGAVDYLIKAHFMPSEVVEKIKHQLKQSRDHGRD